MGEDERVMNVGKLARQETHCQDHSGNLTMINDHKGQITDLYEKHNDTHKLFMEIQATTIKMSAEMNYNFISLKGCLDDMRNDLKEISEKRDAEQELRNAEMFNVNKQLEEINKFSWFRNRMNKWRDNLPETVLKIVLAVFGIIAILHWTDIGAAIKKKFLG
jgi:hypothetical protein